MNKILSTILIFEVQDVISSVNSYIGAKKFQSYISKIKGEKNKLILANRETYYGARLLRKNNSLVSLSTKEIFNKYLSKTYNKDMIKNEFLKTNYDYIILNNNLEYGVDLNEKQINKKYYLKLFGNKMGYIYKKIQ